MQVSRQRVCKALNQGLEFRSVIVLGRTSPRILMERLETRCKRAMLFNIVFHEALDTGYALYGREERLFLRIVVVMHGFTPALAVGQEVTDGDKVRGGYEGRLEIDGVQASYHAVVGECHFGCDIVCGVRCLRNQLSCKRRKRGMDHEHS